MRIRRHNDDMRAATSTNRANLAARAKTVGIIERWKEQLVAGEDLTGTGNLQPTMKVATTPRRAVRSAAMFTGYRTLES